jgi:hypothetical protein
MIGTAAATTLRLIMDQEVTRGVRSFTYNPDIPVERQWLAPDLEVFKVQFLLKNCSWPLHLL